jgi:putative methanogenesis marker protein 12
MFIGIDHGTTSMRFASSDGKVFSIHRQDAAAMHGDELLHSIMKGLEVSKNDILMMAVTYSMGDAINLITPIDCVSDRGITSREGAGLHIGGGTHVYDTIKDSGIPALVIPGLHRGNTPDSRFNVFSHGASPEKLGITYYAHKMGYDNFIVSDISSNTVTLAAAEGRVLGAIDACIFAPGIHHGPLDLAAIRDVDEGLYTANEAFTHAGVTRMTGHSGIDELLNDFNNGDEKAVLAVDTLALFASMEIVSMTLPLKEMGVHSPEVFISGSVSEIQYIREKIEDHISCKVKSLGIWSAAKGCACIAEDVFNGARHILGIGVET